MKDGRIKVSTFDKAFGLLSIIKDTAAKKQAKPY
jgi:hypothetical protein